MTFSIFNYPAIIREIGERTSEVAQSDGEWEWLKVRAAKAALGSAWSRKFHFANEEELHNLAVQYSAEHGPTVEVPTVEQLDAWACSAQFVS